MLSNFFKFYVVGNGRFKDQDSIKLFTRRLLEKSRNYCIKSLSAKKNKDNVSQRNWIPKSNKRNPQAQHKQMGKFGDHQSSETITLKRKNPTIRGNIAEL